MIHPLSFSSAFSIETGILILDRILLAEWQEKAAEQVRNAAERSRIRLPDCFVNHNRLRLADYFTGITNLQCLQRTGNVKENTN